jgi:hypothetical protein
MSKIAEALDNIHNSIIKYVLEFLQTGEFKNKSTYSFMNAYK